MDLTEAEVLRWQEYTEELCKKDLYDPDNHNGVITHLKPDILECEVKWALGSITTNKDNGGDRIPIELFQILKDNAVKASYANKFGNSAVATGLEKVSFHSNPKERQSQRMFRLPHNITRLTHLQSNAQNSPSQASTVCESRTSRCSSWIYKGRGTRDQIDNIH